jgi:dimethylargininase
VKALVRRPSLRLGDGLVTHIPRRPVDVRRAHEQWEAYVRVLEHAGWEIVEAPPLDDCPDGVFVEDAAVVAGAVAIATRPGAPERRAEVESIEETLKSLGYDVAHIVEPGTLDGGDVMVKGDAAYVGVGRRTNGEGARQLHELTALSVVPVPVPHGFLHLKSATTLVPDGTRVAANVLDLGGGRVLVAADDAHVIPLVEARGFEAVTVDISELAKLEAGVTCLSVRLRPTISE